MPWALALRPVGAEESWLIGYGMVRWGRGTGWSVGAGVRDGPLGQGHGMVRWGRGTGWSVGAWAWDGPLGHGHGMVRWGRGTDGPLGQGHGMPCWGGASFFGLAGGGGIGLGEGDGDVAVKGGLCHLMPWL
jgi:hypothetical protein